MGGNIPVGKFLRGNFAGRFFQQGGVDGWEFSPGNFLESWLARYV